MVCYDSIIMICNVKDCENKVFCRKMCSKHYDRYMRYGDVNFVKFVRGDDYARFFSHIEVDDNDCWVWTGTQRGKGYGRIQMRSNGMSVHRFAYEEFIGKIPAGMQIDHLCMNKLCANPEHLEVVTNKENQYRAKENRGCWPIQARKPKIISCVFCGKQVESIMYERRKYCSNSCKCKAQRQRNNLTRP